MNPNLPLREVLKKATVQVVGDNEGLFISGLTIIQWMELVAEFNFLSTNPASKSDEVGQVKIGQ